ncbi:MAG: hypothetical protein HC844_19055 [Tabrizicola sp.]|nr:hypothetical protein [Tabrizicola sp.]
MKPIHATRIAFGLFVCFGHDRGLRRRRRVGGDQKCLFVSSYHRGYEHSDAIERGLRTVLGGKCEVRQFDMDAKRHPDAEGLKQRALEAKEIIQSWRPDIVITADEGPRGAKNVPLKANTDKAVAACPNVHTVLVVKRTGGKIDDAAGVAARGAIAHQPTGRRPLHRRGCRAARLISPACGTHRSDPQAWPELLW